MARPALIEPAIDRALRRARDLNRREGLAYAVDAEDIAREVYDLKTSQDPSPSQRAVVTRAMRDFVRDHKAYALAGGRGRTPLYIVKANAKLPEWLAFPRPPIRPSAPAKPHHRPLPPQDPNRDLLQDDYNYGPQTEEERWHWSAANLFGEVIAAPAYWRREFGDWQKFAVPAELIALRDQAARTMARQLGSDRSPPSQVAEINAFHGELVGFLNDFSGRFTRWRQANPTLDDDGKAALMQALYLCSDGLARLAQQLDGR